MQKHASTRSELNTETDVMYRSVSLHKHQYLNLSCLVLGQTLSCHVLDC